jgi:hypothetical protein
MNSEIRRYLDNEQPLRHRMDDVQPRLVGDAYNLLLSADTLYIALA